LTVIELPETVAVAAPALTKLVTPVQAPAMQGAGSSAADKADTVNRQLTAQVSAAVHPEFMLNLETIANLEVDP
jgi:hypothetical protein